MLSGIILIVVLLTIVIVRNFSKKKVVLPGFKEQFTIAEEDKIGYIEDLFPAINIPEHKFPELISKLNSLRYVVGITKDKIRENLKPMLLDYLIPDYYAIRYRNPGQTNEQLSGDKHNYDYI